MPLFDYKCPTCQLTFEKWSAPQDKDVQGCPTCGRFADRLPSAPAFIVGGFNAKNGYTSKSNT